MAKGDDITGELTGDPFLVWCRTCEDIATIDGCYPPRQAQHDVVRVTLHRYDERQEGDG